MAHLDGLTGIANRRRLEAYLDAMWSRCRSNRKPLAVMMVDVDHFKQFNDHHGHLAGDQLLRQLSVELSGCLRRGEDLVARYGGEEFLVVLPGADIDTALGMAEAMRLKVEQAAIGATISLGVAVVTPNGDGEPDSLVQCANQALYQAKSKGRNRVEFAA